MSPLKRSLTPGERVAKLLSGMSQKAGELDDSITGPIPDGREMPVPVIHLFDERANRAPLDPNKHVIFLAAPKPLYGSLRYASAVNSVILINANEARTLFAADIWKNSAHWRETYRKVLESVTHCYVLCNADGTIGAEQWAELVYLTRDGSALCHLSAYTAPNEQSSHNILRCDGLIKPVPRAEWDWNHAARFQLPVHGERKRGRVKTTRANEISCKRVKSSAKEKSDARA